jgi:hypothetical protein
MTVTGCACFRCATTPRPRECACVLCRPDLHKHHPETERDRTRAELDRLGIAHNLNDTKEQQ